MGPLLAGNGSVGCSSTTIKKLLECVADTALEGCPSSKPRPPSRKAKGVETWMPYAFERVGLRTYADLTEADVSTKPKEFDGKTVNLVTGAKLW